MIRMKLKLKKNFGQYDHLSEEGLESLTRKFKEYFSVFRIKYIKFYY